MLGKTAPNEGNHKIQGDSMVFSDQGLFNVAEQSRYLMNDLSFIYY